MVQMPSVNARVFYFPQGHAEHACGHVDFRTCPRVPPYILSKVCGIKYMADPENDEVFAQIKLVPVNGSEPDYDDDGNGNDIVQRQSFLVWITLLSPLYQTILAKDVHGETWKLDISIGVPPGRHLLTTGWSTFVNHKKLVAGDSNCIFNGAENGDLCVGIRRAKRGIGGGPESSSGWNPAGFLTDKLVVWEQYLRFRFADPLRWPDSPWRLLQVTWDEPDLLQNVKRVSPWLVELVSNMPAIHLSPFSPPRKKLRLPQHPDFPFDGLIPVPTFSSNLLLGHSPFGCLPNSTPAGMQGARHAHYDLSLMDLPLNKLQSGLFSAGLPPFDHAATSPRASNNPMSHQLSLGIVHQMENLIRWLISLMVLDLLFTTRPTKRSLCEGYKWYMDNLQETEPTFETCHCKVFMESEEVGRNLDLSMLGSYEELNRKLVDMFGIENSETLSHVLYRDVTGAVKHIGDEPFR
ncbi:Auxin response factor [Quillaja saponaria]|uniref:Auxin response factor n=1 Tax=Quillaja saponaria TaxID=32244 RepID=A0AAD7QJB7_QUISA|nr:Auxin response factor [Quillaja saponaria]